MRCVAYQKVPYKRINGAICVDSNTHPNLFYFPEVPARQKLKPDENYPSLPPEILPRFYELLASAILSA